MDEPPVFRYLRPFMFRRFHFPRALLLGLALSAAPAAARTAIPVTVASANLSDNITQAYEDPGIRILQALRPDVVAIQEFNYKTGNTQDLVRRLFGPGYHFARESGGVRLPNGVISRYPITAFGQWDDPYVLNRRFFWATIAIPGPKPLHVVSVHLVQNRAERRIPEARLLLQLIRKQFGPDDYIVLCGDFNVTSRDTAAFLELAKWFVDDRQPADQEGNKNTNATRNKPYDFVLPSPALAPLHVPTVLAGQKFPDGLVFDTRLWNPPPAPAEWEDTARDMQHLPVLKTFRIPLR